MNWIDVEVVGINDMTFTRYETFVSAIIKHKHILPISMLIIKMTIIIIVRMDSGLQLSVLEPVAVEYCNQTVN